MVAARLAPAAPLLAALLLATLLSACAAPAKPKPVDVKTTVEEDLTKRFVFPKFPVPTAFVAKLPNELK